MSSVLQMRNTGHREVKELARGHRANKWVPRRQPGELQRKFKGRCAREWLELGSPSD